jgi:predicted AlkP superfamily phosphohydrolase/phosphomutase
MGTPDIQGTYGIFSYYTDHPPLLTEDDFSGGRLVEVWVEDNIVRTELQGPKNDLRAGNEKPYVNVPFTVFIDPVNPVGKIQIQDNEIILKEKEWSDWVRVKFELIPHLKSISGICRFYLKELRPDFKLYVSPINIDPADPAMPISTPAGYSRELAERVGLFYTQGIAEDTKALDNGVFDNKDFLTQSGFVLDESERNFDYELKQFKEGLLFFYFSSLDQGTHMFYRTMDVKHPARIAAEDDPYADALEKLYIAMDRNLGKALEHVDADTTLIVNSDHGFAPFYKSFHLDSWLEKNGYAVLKGVLPGQKGSLFQHTDWSRTRAYALGLNALYVNLYGREANGIVMKGAERNALLEELKQKLLEVRDPETGEQVIAKVYRTDEVYTGPYTEKAPDLIVGYARGYRGSWETALGDFPPDLFSVNKKKWSGDHCMAAEVVPGVIVTNKKIRIEDPALYDIAPTVLREFGLEKEKSMVGRCLF